MTCGQNPSMLQCGMVGNVTSNDMDTTEIVAMLEGCKMPRPTRVLASVITVTYIGRGAARLKKFFIKSVCMPSLACLSRPSWALEHAFPDL